jgi:hypothetical protein
MKPLAASMLLLLFAACATNAPRTDPWRAAVDDSGVYQSSRVEPLRPLIADDTGSVVVATFRATPLPAGTMTIPGDTWVTGVPEVQSRCRAFRGDVGLQVRQLLGLPSDYRGRTFVTFCANAADIFRPSPDARIDRVLPCDPYSADDCGNVFPDSANDAHRAWIGSAIMGTHLWPGGYPFTHLGYTYDWRGRGAAYGASEYILRKGAVVEVLDAQPLEQYCAP